MTGMRLPLKERLLNKTAKIANGCWLWQGSLSNKGYGQIGHKGKIILAHRASYELHVGPIEGKQVLHRCDTPACINPDHLFLGTASENMQDMHKKGRGQHGSSHRWAKLTDSQVEEIKKRDGLTQKQVAAKYGISQAAVSMIRNGKRRPEAFT